MSSLCMYVYQLPLNFGADVKPEIYRAGGAMIVVDRVHPTLFDSLCDVAVYLDPVVNGTFGKTRAHVSLPGQYLITGRC